MRSIAVISLLLCSLSATSNPLATVNSLFDAMRAGDGQAASALTLDGAQLDRAQADGTIRRGSFEKWTHWVNQQSPGDADEQIFATQVTAYGGVANVFAPFLLYYQGELASCGVNQFMLVKTREGWRISYGIDTAYSGDCKTFKADFEQNNAAHRPTALTQGLFLGKS